MTDISHPVTTIAGHDFSPATLPYPAPAIHDPRNGGVVVESAPEDDGQISCQCGFADDDGWTVQCDQCNRWQHQICYYPHYEDQPLPDELQHYCVECKPRPFDREKARKRQKEKREEINGIKRPPAKSHKKKVKEPGHTTNGWPLDKARHDRNSASPRDQPPPSKRPKTSHKPSESISKSHSRKRTVSNVNINSRRSSSRSPEVPIPQYSKEFIKAYNEDDWTITHANLHNSISVTNALSDWLNAPDDKFREKHGGAEKGEILMRWDRGLDEIPGKPHINIDVQTDERQLSDYYEYTPMWKCVTLQEPIAAGAFIGEIKGHVGFRDEYQEDPANRWDELRHPEPFVFFHPRLPITIDARNEGTELRYIRRSCKPNARLQVLVTDQTDYRFCFMATEQIDPNVEVAVSWETTHSVPELFRRLGNGVELSHKDLQHLTNWVSNTLANCGPCACDRPDCLMTRFDRRNDSPQSEGSALPSKIPKGKRKKAGQNISPVNTHLNSRSGSEARKIDPDDDPTDSSASAGRGSASRDITPNLHYPHGPPAEMSERERKKFEREEAIFRRQEEEKNTKSGKKKRNSGGSTLNTPNPSHSKGFGGVSSNYVNAATSKQSGLPAAKPGRRSKVTNHDKTPPRQIIKTIKRPKPDYVDSAVQCDMDGEELERRKAESGPRKPFLSHTQRLLQRCALNNARRRGPVALAEATKCLTVVDEKMDVDPPPTDPTTHDTEMKDAPPSPPQPATMPPPPWPSQAAHSARPSKPTTLEMPPPPPTLPDPTLTASPAALDPGPIAPSPPAKKKISFSDYVAKNKKAVKGREESPASVASVPAVPGVLGEGGVVEEVAVESGAGNGDGGEVKVEAAAVVGEKEKEKEKG